MKFTCLNWRFLTLTSLAISRMAVADYPEPSDFAALGLDPSVVTADQVNSADQVHEAYVRESLKARGDLQKQARLDIVYLHFQSEIAYSYPLIRKIRKFDPRMLLAQRLATRTELDGSEKFPPSYLSLMIEFQDKSVRTLDPNWPKKASVVSAFSQNLRTHVELYLSPRGLHRPRLIELIQVGSLLDQPTQNWFWKWVEDREPDRALKLIFLAFRMGDEQRGVAMALRWARLEHGFTLDRAWFLASFNALSRATEDGKLKPTASTFQILHVLRESAKTLPEALEAVSRALYFSNAAVLADPTVNVSELAARPGRLDYGASSPEEKFELYLCLKNITPLDPGIFSDLSLH